MQKMWFMVMLVAFLLGQVPLAGSFVICTTEDGQTRLETPDHHHHGLSKDPEDACDHDPHALHADVRCAGGLSQSACCRDITVDCASPSLVEAKRVGPGTHSPSPSLIKANGPLQHPMHVTSLSHHSPGTGPEGLRSVILLI